MNPVKIVLSTSIYTSINDFAAWWESSQFADNSKFTATDRALAEVAWNAAINTAALKLLELKDGSSKR
jgi:hypothetical protein